LKSLIGVSIFTGGSPVSTRPSTGYCRFVRHSRFPLENNPTMSDHTTESELPLTEPQAYARPEQFCDIVMKGGITSGVAYPLAVCELARRYSFKSIGGASAGAIAAAAAAAAEYNRRATQARKDDDSGFAGLAKLPAWLKDDEHLARLFQPNPSTRPLFNILDRVLRTGGGGFKKLMATLPTAWSNFSGWALSGIVASLLLLLPLIVVGYWFADAINSKAFPATDWRRSLLLIYGSIFALAFIFLVGCVFVLVGLLRKIRSSIPQNNYGLTTGLLDAEGRATATPALTTWLADEIDRIAGKPPRAEPLTFGDLRGAANDLDKENLPPEEWGLSLQMMTTNLTLGRPYRLPFERDSAEFFYDPKEWEQYFPAYIMKWLDEHPRQPTETAPGKIDKQKAEWKRFEPRKPLPAPDDLPIVIAARMSLSFPVLISAVPLWTVDRSRKLTDEETGAVRPTRLERCLFSDGGISSNFPIHFFDRALPRWVTFGIDLQSFHPDYPPDQKDQSKNSYLVRTNRAGLADPWDRFDANPSDLSRLAGFFGALINTMYNWADNAQVRVPGYRDRVVHIFQTDQEGGLNLNMEPDKIEALGERGRFAGVKLRERFTGQDNSPLTWDNHRWIRYRSMFALLEQTLRDLRRAYRSPLFGDTPFKSLVERARTEPPEGYRLSEPEQREFAARVTELIIALGDEWEEERKTSGQSFGAGAPRPTPELRVRPRI
jgi:predicted acylesterase/phospholipase RssA